MESNIKVSIIMLAYNHGKFIGQAIDSILMQKVDFKYEVIIAEDCSVDNTRDVIYEYEIKYPKIIKPIIRENNIGSTKNFYEALLKCQGEYIACLEGDDFWIDPYKLQKQVDFLSNNAEYIGVVHRNIIVDNRGKKIGCSSLKVPIETTIGKKELLKYTTMLAHPSTMCYRNIFKNSEEDFSIIANSNKYGTHFSMLAILIRKAPIYMMASYMSAWRCIISENATNYTSMAEKKPLEAADNYFTMISNFKKYFGDYYDFTKLNSKHFASSIFLILKLRKDKRWKYYKKFSSYLSNKEKFMSIIYFFAKGIHIAYSKLNNILKSNKEN